MPHVFYIRGWAPYGCSNRQKLPRAEAKAEIARINALLSQDLRARIEPLEPYSINHQLAYKFKNESRDGAYAVAEAIQGILETNAFSIRNCACRAQVEISPDRKRVCRNFFEATERRFREGEREGRKGTGG